VYRARVVQLLCIELNITKLETAPYSQFQNSAETVMKYLTRFLRSLTAEQLQSWGSYMPMLSAFFNDTPDSITGIPPAHHERPWRAIPRGDRIRGDAVLPEPADVRAYSKRVTEIHQIHVRILNEIREPTIGAQLTRRNERQRATRRYSVGDRVATARRRTVPGVSDKLLLQWDGPYKVTGSISANIFELRHELTNATTTASPGNMVPFTASVEAAQAYFALMQSRVPVLARATPANDADYHLLPDALQVDTIVALWDTDTGGRQYWLGKVLSIDAVAFEVTVHYYGVTSKSHPRVKLVWQHTIADPPGVALSFVRHPRSAPWSGVECYSSIFVTGVILHADGSLQTPISAKPTTMREAAQ